MSNERRKRLCLVDLTRDKRAHLHYLPGAQRKFTVSEFILVLVPVVCILGCITRWYHLGNSALEKVVKA